MNDRLYRTINKELLDLLKISVNKEYYYIHDGEEKTVYEQNFENSNNENQVQLIDCEDSWDNKCQSLYMNCTLTLENADLLFLDVCCSDAVLGIGIEWKSDKSRIKYCEKIGEFTIKNKTCVFKKNNIDLKNVSSNIHFRWVIYIVKPGTKNYKLSYGNQTGLILGDGDLWTIIVEGSGSIFPIYEEMIPDGPLWLYNCDFIDITEDEFNEENIKIILNKSHKAYQFIQPKSPTYNKFMFSELISNAITTLILSIKKKNEENGNGGKIDFSIKSNKGSILNVLKYFNETLKFKINGSIQELQNSIKNYFDKEY